MYAGCARRWGGLRDAFHMPREVEWLSPCVRLLLWSEWQLAQQIQDPLRLAPLPVAPHLPLQQLIPRLAFALRFSA